MSTVRGDPLVAVAWLNLVLAAGWLRCPGCRGELGPWGHARPRRIRYGLAPDGWSGRRSVRWRSVLVVPRRTRCRWCGRTHVLLPDGLLSRRAYSGSTVFAVLRLRDRGLSWAAIAARSGVPASTGWSWWHRMAGHAPSVRQVLAELAGRLGWAVPPVTASVGGVLRLLDRVAERLTAVLTPAGSTGGTGGTGVDGVAAYQAGSHLSDGLLLAPTCGLTASVWRNTSVHAW